ncbi:MAG: cation-translocating P-type ATPase [Gammaproteobacteria bacterium]|nr:cation-translocating P-type ATPase [Gammaproteobacteria bacterium]
MAQNISQTSLWHTLAATQVLSTLAVDNSGLSAAESAIRLAQTGPNALPKGRRNSLAQMFGSQFTDFMIIVLLVAAVVSGLLGDLIDSLVIVIIVLLNALIGTVQEYRAAQAMAALKALAGFQARVVREGQVLAVAAADLVPGDMVLIEAGDVVPADLRLLESARLQADEAALTGESRAIDKITESLDKPDLPLGDRINMAFKGTVITHGRGRGVVVATGLATELGKIALLLEDADSGQTPLQKRLARFGKRLALAVLAICAILFVGGLLRGEPAMLMFLTAVSLAVAAIPEALPAVITMTLAIGARRMSREQALIRHLPAVETLGSVTFICADKTGTLTQNKMHAEVVVCAGIRSTKLLPAEAASDAWRHLAQAMALNNDVRAGDRELWIGDPTEVALLAAATQAGYAKLELEKQFPRCCELPFDATRKRMSTIHRAADQYIAYVKGAPEQVLAYCTAAMGLEFDRRAILAQADALAAEGYRVLAYACRSMPQVPTLTPEHIETDLSFLGLVALIDPPRAEVPAAIEDCRTAGITPVMITGDHPATARVIAQRLGLMGAHDEVITGVELERMDDAEFDRRLAHVRVFARVSPEQKINIVSALQARGEFVAMTGDGVNDAPALKRADIGVAMGKKGTDVAREAADMVLLDDNFATIVTAVREGRRIFDNIRKFIRYGMTTNSGEIWTLMLAPMLGMPIPLTPIQILWINLVTDGLPGLALAAEPEERGIMRRPPRPPSESIFAGGMWQHIIWVGLLIGGLSVMTQAYAIAQGDAHWQTMVFTILTLTQLVHVMVIRSERESIFTMGIATNRMLLGAVLLTLALHMAVVYVPWLNGVFNTQPLSVEELAFCVAISMTVLVAVEIEKWAIRRGWLYRVSNEVTQ